MAYEHLNELNVHCHIGTIGAVFDFFAGTVQRAPQWWQRNGLEWAYRLLKEPKRMWRRYIIGNVLFLWNILKEKKWNDYGSLINREYFMKKIDINFRYYRTRWFISGRIFNRKRL